MCLRALKNDPKYQVVSLLTTVTEGYDRISMHGVRRCLLEQQAKALGLPLHQVVIPQQCSNADYEAAMRAALTHFQSQGVTGCAFGDLFLEDVRDYRERNLARIGMAAVFPLWGRQPTVLVEEFIALGFKARVVCLDPKAFNISFAGRIVDEDFLRDLPPGVDPCGENGEFHTFVVNGPIFNHPVACAVGEVVVRDGFCFCDLLPG